ncbi:MAG: nicotinate-nicotinamide nucleotide adenylyltransferase [Phycisphaerales bacterium JB039]
MPPITPLPVPDSAAGVLLYGGSFDPPHIAHVKLALAARNAIDARAGARFWLVYVPAARSPHKHSGPQATGPQRIRMLELALDGRAGAAIWTDEIDRAVAGEPSYWINTVRRARAALGDGPELRFLIGADQAVQFHRWREARAILQIADAAVIGRDPIDSAAALRRAMAQPGFWTDAELDAWADRFVDVGTLKAASTDVRAGNGHEIAPAVAAYIAQQGLYPGTTPLRGGPSSPPPPAAP